MPTCTHCGNDYATEQLVRHERPRLVVIHCPGCRAPLGRYHRHGDNPQIDHSRRV